MTIKKTFIEEIENQIEGLSDLEMGTDQYNKSVDGITKLSAQLIELEKLEVERENKYDEITLKHVQMEEERKDRKIKNWLTGAGIAIPTLAAIWGTKASFKFEQTGTVTTILGRGWLNKLLPKK